MKMRRDGSELGEDIGRRNGWKGKMKIDCIQWGKRRQDEGREGKIRV